ncbi:hypothetical protein [Streptomyces sp. H27-S2]|uniref:hypothetical protein n=1 Tax=Streptomyces antarcticus TaxID=2996458 RepID=UPI00226DFFE9|nr:hypothetical protein [Streptomyces sp. H27-S2]MCY0949135.1 hypothetical protein [Streptomyces sp. H27-S2]
MTSRQVPAAPPGPAIRLTLAAVVLLTAAVLSVAGAGPAAATGPSVTVDDPRAAPGLPVKASGAGWQPGVTVQVEVCGGEALHGSADCDTLRAAVALVAADGTFRLTLIAGAPPAACPCVLRAVAGQSGVRAQTPLTLAGAADAAPTAPVPAVRVDVVAAALSGGPRFAELFGAPAHRTLTVTLRNPGDRPLGRAPLIVAWGPGGSADLPVGTPLTAELPPHAEQTYRIPVRLPAAAFGRYSVGGRYASAEFAVSTDVYPWGLLGLAFLAALLTVFTAAVAVRRGVERRRAGRPSRAPGSAPAALPAFVDAGRLAEVLAVGAGDGEHPGLVSTRALVRELAGDAALVDFRALRAFADALRASPLETER